MCRALGPSLPRGRASEEGLGRVVRPPPHPEREGQEPSGGRKRGWAPAACGLAAGFGEVPGKRALLPGEDQRGWCRWAGEWSEQADSGMRVGCAREGGPTEAGGDSQAGDGWPGEGEVTRAECGSP